MQLLKGPWEGEVPGGGGGGGRWRGCLGLFILFIYFFTIEHSLHDELK